jgi:hypothetical protein
LNICARSGSLPRERRNAVVTAVFAGPSWRERLRVRAEDERLGRGKTDVSPIVGALDHTRQREVDLQRDRCIVDVDPVRVEATAQARAWREHREPDLAVVPDRAARGLEMAERQLFKLAHHLVVARGRVVVARLPQLADIVRAVLAQQRRHPADVVVMRMRRHDEIDQRLRAREDPGRSETSE